jgi:hypothetical protein
MRVLLTIGMGMLGGCAGDYRDPPMGTDHPASAGAAPAPERERSGVLVRAEPTGDPSANAPAPPTEAHTGHDHGAHEPAPADGNTAAAATYTCPMHREVTSKEPGRCPRCGMALVVEEKQ